MPLASTDSQRLAVLAGEAARLGRTVDELLEMIKNSGGQGGDIAAAVTAHNNYAEAHKDIFKDASESFKAAIKEHGDVADAHQGLFNEIQSDIVKKYHIGAIQSRPQDFNTYLTSGLWCFNPAAHLNGPPASDGTDTLGGFLRITSSEDNQRVFQEYLVWQSSAVQSVIYTRGYHVDIAAWGEWAGSQNAIDPKKLISHAVPSEAAPLFMPYTGYVVVVLGASSGLVVDGLGIVFTQTSAIHATSPLIKKNTPVWIVGTASNFWTASTISG